MPVRIYEIAKKVGIPSKEVLAKAKELGITNAKVASSTLDKITAEYLEEKIAGTKEPEPEPVPIAVEPIIITAPVEEPEEEIAEEAEPDTAEETEVEAEPEQDAAGEEAAEAEEPEEEEAPSELGKKVGFIELGNMPVRPAIRERKGKKGAKKESKIAPAPAAPAAKPAARPAAPGPPKPKYTAPANGPLIAMKPPIIVRDLAEEMKRKPFQLIADLMALNVFANINQSIEEPVAREICAKHGFRFRLERRERGAGLVKTSTMKKVVLDADDIEEDLQSPRPSGHDHGPRGSRQNHTARRHPPLEHHRR